jgi:L-ascorbate metabolism protein UlaG (beta-lactamase superfamily)
VRILYDPGRTTDETDPRVGEVHVMLLSHLHSDHIGDARPAAPGAGTCGNPTTVSAAPNGTFAAIAAAKRSAVFAAGEMADFLGRKIQAIRGVATPGCATAGFANETAVPAPTVCTASLRPGGTRTVKFAAAESGVRIAAVPAIHSNAPPAALLDAGATGPYGGTESGFVIQFTNGLTAYLTGDTGMFGDMESVIARYYRPNLMVPNISDTVTLGADEAAFVAKELVRPATVMPSHANEASTAGGSVVPGTRTERLTQLLRAQIGSAGVAVVVPLSGVAREFDGDGRCVNCR